ncbi:MAG: hypothetical protein PSN37_04815 [Alphaproteobacteria bacterium]|nr:hypothetical protein [Alphaproteobacteria bacterium]
MIRDYPELISEVSARSGMPDLIHRAGMFVSMAETMLSKCLHFSSLEKRVTLVTDQDGFALLPTDCKAPHSVLVEGKNLEYTSPDLIKKGQTCVYAIQGALLFSSQRGVSHLCLYESCIPSLETANKNWLLEREPEIYLHAVLFQVYTAAHEIEKAKETAAYLTHLIELSNQVDALRCYAFRRVRFGTVAP